MGTNDTSILDSQLLLNILKLHESINGKHQGEAKQKILSSQLKLDGSFELEKSNSPYPSDQYGIRMYLPKVSMGSVKPF